MALLRVSGLTATQTRISRGDRAFSCRVSSAPVEVRFPFLQEKVQAGVHLAEHVKAYGTPTVTVLTPSMAMEYGPAERGGGWEVRVSFAQGYSEVFENRWELFVFLVYE